MSTRSATSFPFFVALLIFEINLVYIFILLNIIFGSEMFGDCLGVSASKRERVRVGESSFRYKRGMICFI